MDVIHPIQAGYALVFAVTSLACFGTIPRAIHRLDDTDTRVGLVALLLTSGLWAGAYVGRLLSPTPDSQLVFYLVGLVQGLATVGAWLYFCSAYAGKSFHKHPVIRRFAVFVFALIVAVKLTSPIHGLYFSATTATEPFPYLAIELGLLHWIVTGLAYALSAVGFYILFEAFQGSSYATGRLQFLLGLAALPVVFDLLSYFGIGPVLTFNYEPIGVGLFAVGVLYVADWSFLAVQRFGREQLLDELDEAILILDTDWRIRDTNETARDLFPALAGNPGAPLSEAVPALDDHLPAGRSRVIQLGEAAPARDYLLSVQPLTVGQSTVGRAVVLTDVTDIERQRRQVQRQETQLDSFEEAITHELRNTINVVQGNIELVGMELDDKSDVEDRIRTASKAADRMGTIVSDLVILARLGRTTEEIECVDVAEVARRAFSAVAGADHTLTAAEVGTVEADGRRTEQLFESLFEFAVRNGATEIDLARSDGRLVVTDNGRPLSPDDVERAFSYGQAVPDAESGMLLPVVRTLAAAQGWGIDTDRTYEAGVRFVIEFEPANADADAPQPPRQRP
jgi:signal transduction histidine kinase